MITSGFFAGFPYHSTAALSASAAFDFLRLTRHHRRHFSARALRMLPRTLRLTSTPTTPWKAFVPLSYTWKRAGDSALVNRSFSANRSWLVYRFVISESFSCFACASRPTASLTAFW